MLVGKNVEDCTIAVLYKYSMTHDKGNVPLVEASPLSLSYGELKSNTMEYSICLSMVCCYDQSF